MSILFGHRTKFDGDQFLKWYENESSDVLIASHNMIYFYLRSKGIDIPKDLAYLGLVKDYAPDQGHISCVDRLADKLAKYAVDFLHQLD